MREARDAGVQEPPVFPVRPPKPVFHFELPARIERSSIRGQTMIKIFGVNAGGPPVPKLFWHRPPGKCEPLLVQEGNERVRTRYPDHDRRRVGHDAKPLLALA